MTKFVRIALVVAAFGMPLSFGLTGCGGDDAGGNESEALQKAGVGPGTAPANAPPTQEEMYKQQKSKEKANASGKAAEK